MVREIDDPHTGDRWKLMRDPVHPEGPGRLVLVTGPGIEPVSAGNSRRKTASHIGHKARRRSIL